MNKISTKDIKIFGMALQNFLKSGVSIRFFKTFIYAEDDVGKIKYTYSLPIDDEFTFEYSDFMAIYKLCSIDDGENNITIKINNNVATVKYLKISKRLKLQSSDRDIIVPLLGEEIKIDIIDKAVIATSAIKNNNTFYHSKIIDVYSDGNEIFFSLTDGATIFFYKTKTDSPEFRMQIPVRKIIKLKNVVDFESFAISTDNKFVCINGGNLKAYSLLSDAKFMDMTKKSYQDMLIFRNDAPIFSIDRQKFRDELYKIKVLLSNYNKNEMPKIRIFNDNNKFNIEAGDTMIELESISGNGDIDVVLGLDRTYNVVNSIKTKNMKMQINSMVLLADDNNYKIGIAKMRKT